VYKRQALIWSFSPFHLADTNFNVWFACCVCMSAHVVCVWVFFVFFFHGSLVTRSLLYWCRFVIWYGCAHWSFPCCLQTAISFPFDASKATSWCQCWQVLCHMSNLFSDFFLWRVLTNKCCAFVAYVEGRDEVDRGGSHQTLTQVSFFACIV
jgi:hypothetical protein